jgi:hypothetical protein
VLQVRIVPKTRAKLKKRPFLCWRKDKTKTGLVLRRETERSRGDETL